MVPMIRFCASRKSVSSIFFWMLSTASSRRIESNPQKALSLPSKMFVKLRTAFVKFLLLWSCDPSSVEFSHFLCLSIANLTVSSSWAILPEANSVSSISPERVLNAMVGSSSFLRTSLALLIDLSTSGFVQLLSQVGKVNSVAIAVSMDTKLF